MSNDLPCGKCAHYDPILGPKEKETKRGWCAKKSVYPTIEGPGQVFPKGVQRQAKATDMAKPVIVRKVQVVPACPYVKPASVLNAVQQKKESQVVRDKHGRRVLS